MVDVFVLAECCELRSILTALNNLDIGTYREEAYVETKVRALTRLGGNAFIHSATSLGDEMVVWAIQAEELDGFEILLAGLHLPAKIGGSTETDQAFIAKEVNEELERLEDNRRHTNTILVGDFNMEPYDPGMSTVGGIYGLMTKKLAGLPEREHRGKPRRRFYNPMWGLFGDRTPGPAGTYCWPSAVLHNRYWAMLVQVLIRPTLINHFHDLRILDYDGRHSLLDHSDKPDREISDHLPILFLLKQGGS